LGTQFKDHLRNLKRAVWWVCCLPLVLGSCVSFEKSFHKELTTTFKDEFVGFILVDPATDEVLIEHQSKLHFTPASNTKLLTFYVADRMINDSVPAFKYHQRGDSLWLMGTGDPTLLHPDYAQAKVMDLLTDRTITLIKNPQPLPLFGSGWAWDDFSGSYQRHRSWLPLHANAVQITQDSAQGITSVKPSFFKPAIRPADTSKLFTREPEANIFYPPSHRDTVNMPYRWDWELAALLLQEATGSKVQLQSYQQFETPSTFYQHHKDSLFKPLLQESDNFIAEQLILICAQLGESRADTTLKWLTDSLLSDLPDRPIWVDGSGLSRYNMITPRSLTALLLKMKREIPQERLFALLPSGGVNGTIENYYSAEEPYIFAKTGTLRHNHNLSGYLITKSKQVLAFSFMHNHFTGSNAAVKIKMEQLLRQIRDHY